MVVLSFCVMLGCRPDDFGCRMVLHSGGLKFAVRKSLQMLFLPDIKCSPLLFVDRLLVDGAYRHVYHVDLKLFRPGFYPMC